MIARVARQDQRLRFLVVGGYNTLFGLAVFAGLYAALHSRVHYLLILVVAHVLAIANAFTTYRLLVFGHTGAVWPSLGRFGLVYGFLFVANAAGLVVLVEIIGLPVFAAQVLLVVASVTLSYVLHGRFTFRRTLPE